jgi:hypothetical protein
MRRNSTDAINQLNNFERRAAADQRHEELRQKYAGMERKAAFKKAWRLVKAGEVRLTVNSVTFGSRQKAPVKLARYKPKDIHILLVPEPENHLDPNAVAVKVLVQGSQATYKLGYVSASQTKIAKAFLGRVPYLSIVGSDLLGARLSIAV